MPEGMLARRKFDADYAAVRDLGPWFRDELMRIGAHAALARAGEIELALHELAVNVIDHAKADALELVLESLEDSLLVVCTDAGVPFDVETSWPEAPTKPQVRGYGLMIVEQIAADVSYQRLANGTNEWRLLFDTPVPDDL